MVYLEFKDRYQGFPAVFFFHVREHNSAIFMKKTWYNMFQKRHF